jgi:hypothetical protein
MHRRGRRSIAGIKFHLVLHPSSKLEPIRSVLSPEVLRRLNSTASFHYIIPSDNRQTDKYCNKATQIFKANFQVWSEDKSRLIMRLLLQGGGKNQSYRSDCAIPVVHSHEVRLWSRLTFTVTHFVTSVCLVCLASKTGSLRSTWVRLIRQPLASAAVSDALQSAVWTAHVFSPLSCP